MAFLTVQNVGQYGVISDITPAELPPNAWSGATNIRFRDGYAERFEGQSNLFTAPTVTPYHIAPYGTTTDKWWIHSGLTQIFADNGTGRDEITPVSAQTGAIDDRYTGGTLNGVFVLNNGVNAPWYWGGSGVLAPIAAWPAGVLAAVVRPWKDYLILLDVTESATRYQHRVRWSAAAEPGTLPASFSLTDATLDAGELDLAETTGPLVDCLPLGNANIIYKEDALYAQTLIGIPYVFNFQRLPGDSGLLARGCVVNTPVGHVALTPGDVIVHQGQGPRSILTGTQRRTLFAAIDATNYKRSFLAANVLRNEVWICYPESGETACTRALVWNWADNTFGERTLNQVTYGASGPVIGTADTDKLLLEDGAYILLEDGGKLILQDSANPQTASSQARLVTCSTSPAITVADEGDSFSNDHLLLEDGAALLLEDGSYLLLDGGEAFTATLERKDLVFDGDMTSHKTMRTVVPRIEAVAGTEIFIQPGGRDDVEVDVTWGTAVPYVVGTSRKADIRSTYRFPAIRFYSTGEDFWRLKSYDLDVTKGGTR